MLMGAEKPTPAFHVGNMHDTIKKHENNDNHNYESIMTRWDTVTNDSAILRWYTVNKDSLNNGSIMMRWDTVTNDSLNYDSIMMR